MQPLAQPPRKDDRSFDDWMYRLWKRISSTAGIAWSLIDKTGSNLTDLTTRNHADLQNINTASYTHLTSANATDLTDGGDSTLHYHASDRARANHTGTQDTTTITVDSIGGTSTLQNSMNDTNSAGYVDGFTITDTGGGNISVAAGECTLRSSASNLAQIYHVTISTPTALSIPSNTVRYVVVDYNSGSPVVQLDTTSPTQFYTKCYLAEVHNHAGSLHIHFDPRATGDIANRVIGWANGLIGIRVESGDLVSAVATTRTIAVTASTIWDGNFNEFSESAVDTSAGGTFSLEYRDGAGGWTEVAAQTAWPNTQYDNGTGTLATLGNNKWGVLWFIRELQDGIYVQYGQAEYANQADAELASPPATRPEYLVEHGYYIAKLVFEKSASTYAVIQDYRPLIGAGTSSSSASNHNNLSGLQGGTANEYYHLTSAQHTDLTDGGDSTLHYHAADRALANATGTLAIANGGSGQTTAQAAMNAFAGAVTSGSYLRGNGTNVVMSAIQAADVPTLNQNTTGTASNVTGTVAIANGGTGQTTAQLAINALTNVSSATNEYVLTKDTATGDAVFKAAAAASATVAPEKIPTITATVAANALTIGMTAQYLDFRSTTLGSGTITTVNCAPSNLVVSSGSTLGTTSGVLSRLAVICMNNAGTAELAVVNLFGGTDLSENGLISTTAEGGAGAADSASVIYSTTARTNLAYRVVGYIESTQATAGTWATAPSTIQGNGGNAHINLKQAANLYNSANVTMTTANTWYKMTVNTVIGTNTGIADTANSRIVINKAGRYYIEGECEILQASFAGQSRAAIYKNGTILRGGTVVAAGVTYVANPDVFIVLDLVSGDYIELYAVNNQNGCTAQTPGCQLTVFEL